jgi:CubicO group peptidase (beta-lactamase class C family)
MSFLFTVPTLADDTISTFLQDHASDQGDIGIAAARIVDGQPEFGAIGPLQQGATAPVTADTIFEIGSISKVFTNLLLAQLVLEGRMALDQPARIYLPEGVDLPTFKGQEMTLFDLATHSAGLPAVPPEMIFADPSNPYRAYTADMLFTSLTSYELKAAPGTHFSYSNIGAALLGLAIAHVEGQPFDMLVAERILAPLGMSETYLGVPKAAGTRFATAHNATGEPVSHWDFGVFSPAGGYRSTVSDMAKFAAAASRQVETPLKEALALMLERTRPTDRASMSVGLGWMISDAPGGRIVWHNGMTGGFNAFIGFAEDGSTASVALANRAGAIGVEDIGFRLIVGTEK